MLQEKLLGGDVLAAARKRISNIFRNGLPVYMSFSGGKDSLVLADITYKMIQRGEIDRSLLRMEFVDEEAIFPCVEQIVMDWRERLGEIGVPTDWYCLEVLHYSCLNMLENDESFICWDRDKKDVWVRDKPAFAITHHSKLLPRELWKHRVYGKTYQEFLSNIDDGLHMTGVRASESIQRRSFMSRLPASGIPKCASSAIHPIYDWSDGDVWRYLAENDVKVPDAYLYLYQIGSPRKALRISQFFSIDTVASLSRIAQFYPGLMERILAREPTAYLVSLYWNSEMFRRRSTTRRSLEQAATDEAVDHRQRMIDLLKNPPEQVRRSDAALKVLTNYRTMLLKFGSMMTQDHYRTACEALISGDPKNRVKRALISQIVKGQTATLKRDAAAALAAGAGEQRTDRAARQPPTQRLQPQHRPGRQPRASHAINPD
jgi:predicted phosphoadenosine phosphosulfate sulfurtransferase